MIGLAFGLTRGWRYLRYCLRGGHAWREDGPTLGGIWLRCATCDTVEEFLPGLHEPEGGEPIWRERLAKDREAFE